MILELLQFSTLGRSLKELFIDKLKKCKDRL